jgi:hypothetical protein
MIASFLVRLHGSPLQGLRKDRATAKEVLSKHGLCPASFLDANNGGATDARHVLGFGRNLDSDILPTLSDGLPCTLCHFFDGSTAGFFPHMAWVARSSIPVVSKPPWKVLWHMNAVFGEGLFPCSQLLSLVYCPSHFFPWQWVWRSLSI